MSKKRRENDQNRPGPVSREMKWQNSAAREQKTPRKMAETSPGQKYIRADSPDHSVVTHTVQTASGVGS